MVFMVIEEKVLEVRETIPKNVALVAAVKYISNEQILELIKSGVLDLGFNTYQQLKSVKPLLASSIRAHFIGHLQANKARKVLECGISLVQSVDSYKLASKIDSVCSELGFNQGILLQVKTDESKSYGIMPAEIEKIALKIEKNLSNVKIKGLMTIPPIANPEEARKYFLLTKKIFDSLSKKLGRKMEYLSMGMSDDYKVAIEEGANMVRIGRALFR